MISVVFQRMEAFDLRWEMVEGFSLLLFSSSLFVVVVVVVALKKKCSRVLQ